MKTKLKSGSFVGKGSEFTLIIIYLVTRLLYIFEERLAWFLYFEISQNTHTVITNWYESRAWMSTHTLNSRWIPYYLFRCVCFSYTDFFLDNIIWAYRYQIFCFFSWAILRDMTHMLQQQPINGPLNNNRAHIRQKKKNGSTASIRFFLFNSHSE